MRTQVGLSVMNEAFRSIAVGHEVLAQGIPAKAGADVTVSEVATYGFCAKAWHLERALQRPVSRETLERRALGTALHHEHGTETGKARDLYRILCVRSYS